MKKKLALRIIITRKHYNNLLVSNGKTKQKRKLEKVAKTRISLKTSGLKLREPHKCRPKLLTATYQETSVVIKNCLKFLIAVKETIEPTTGFTNSLKHLENIRCRSQ